MHVSSVFSSWRIETALLPWLILKVKSESILSSYGLLRCDAFFKAFKSWVCAHTSAECFYVSHDHKIELLARNRIAVTRVERARRCDRRRCSFCARNVLSFERLQLSVEESFVNMFSDCILYIVCHSCRLTFTPCPRMVYFLIRKTEKCLLQGLPTTTFYFPIALTVTVSHLFFS